MQINSVDSWHVESVYGSVGERCECMLWLGGGLISKIFGINNYFITIFYDFFIGVWRGLYFELLRTYCFKNSPFA